MTEELEKESSRQLDHVQARLTLEFLGTKSPNCVLNSAEEAALISSSECIEYLQARSAEGETWQPALAEMVSGYTRLDGLLNPDTWRSVLQNWAITRAEEIANSSREQPWANLALGTLRRYLRAVGIS